MPWSIPVLESPADQAESQSPTPTLTWTEDQGEGGYQVQVANDQEMSDIILDVSWENLDGMPLYPPLPRLGPYYWRVRVGGEAGPGWSDVSSFTVDQPNLGYTPQFDHVGAAKSLLLYQFQGGG